MSGDNSGDDDNDGAGVDGDSAIISGDGVTTSKWSLGWHRSGQKSWGDKEKFNADGDETDQKHDDGDDDDQDQDEGNDLVPPCPLLWHRRAFRELQLLQIICYSDDYPDPLATLINVIMIKRERWWWSNMTMMIMMIKRERWSLIKYDDDDQDDDGEREREMMVIKYDDNWRMQGAPNPLANSNPKMHLFKMIRVTLSKRYFWICIWVFTLVYLYFCI